MLVILATTAISTARAGIINDVYEPNNTPGQAKALTNGTYELALGYVGDIDYFNVTVTSGGTITINVTTMSMISVNLKNQTNVIKGTSATSSSAGSIVHVAKYTGNHTIECTNAVSCMYNLTITVTAASSTPSTPSTPGPNVPGYDACLIIALTAIGFTCSCVLVRRSLYKRKG